MACESSPNAGYFVLCALEDTLYLYAVNVVIKADQGHELYFFFFYFIYRDIEKKKSFLE